MTEDQELEERERTAFGALPRERIPPAHLEERVVGALRHQGLLSGGRRTRRGPALAAALVAGLALFAAGAATGLRLAESPAGMGARTDAADPEARAARVQETGSAYVRAVSRLAGTDGGELPADGLEAARAALHAAALELARLGPDDATMKLVLAVLEERAGVDSSADPVERRTTFWF